MIIDELNERFNDLRAKKWRTVCTKTPAEVTGFYKYAGGDYIVVTSDDDLWSVQPDTLFRYSLGERTPYIEEAPPLPFPPTPIGLSTRRYWCGMKERQKTNGILRASLQKDTQKHGTTDIQVGQQIHGLRGTTPNSRRISYPCNP